jgi:hypothetical protein
MGLHETKYALVGGSSINIRNEMSIEDIVNETGVWQYQPSNQDQSPRKSLTGHR